MGDDKQFPGLRFDPTPGIVPAVDTLLGQVRDASMKFAQLQGDLDRVGLDHQAWVGLAGKQFHAQVDKLIPSVGFMKEALLDVQMQLSSWSALLSQYQQTRTTLDEQAVAARARVTAAENDPNMGMKPHGFEDKDEYERKTSLYNGAKAALDAAEKDLDAVIDAAKSLEGQHKSSAETVAKEIHEAARLIGQLKGSGGEIKRSGSDQVNQTVDTVTGRGPGEHRDSEDLGKRDDLPYQKRSESRGFDLNSDWAGRDILQRYLTGGGDWTIVNDPDWNAYLNANPAMVSVLEGRPGPAQLAADNASPPPPFSGYYAGPTLGVQPGWYPEIALAAVQSSQSSGTFQEFSITRPLEIDNGEGMVGYQYLHGTNKDAGGFNAQGHTTVTKNEQGQYVVRITADLTFNDIVDPNNIYDTDKGKAVIAEIISLGQADPYKLSITWPRDAEVVIAPDGKTVVDVKSQPGKR